MMTMSELAGRLGLDKSSVSLALRGSRKISAPTRQRVLAAARKLGYRPNLAARQLASSGPIVLGMVLPATFVTLGSGAAVASIQSVGQHAAGAGLLFTILSIDDLRPTGEAAPLCPDGLLVWGDVHADEVRKLSALRRPIVVLDPHDSSYADYAGVTVGPDNAGGARAIIEHLLQRGAEHVLFVHWETHHLGFALRAKSAEEAWRASPRARGWSAAQIDSITDAELSAFVRKRWPVIFCCNDLIAMRIWHRLNRLGVRVPGDVLLAGFDGDGHGRMVDLTTAAFDGEAVGAAAFAQMRRLLDHRRLPRNETKHVVTPVRLHIGKTTAGWER